MRVIITPTNECGAESSVDSSVSPRLKASRIGRFRIGSNLYKNLMTAPFRQYSELSAYTRHAAGAMRRVTSP